MAALAKRKFIGSTFGNEEVVERVTYDFTVDAGATGALDIFEAAADCVITYFHAYIKVACTSGGSATLKVGYTGSDAAYITTTQGAVANLTLGALFQANVVLTEGTPNTAAFPLPHKLVTGAKILQTIGVQTFLTGKIEYVIKYVKA